MTLRTLAFPLFLLAGCAATQPDTGLTRPDGDPAAKTKPVTPTLPTEIAAANNAFASDLYGKLRARKGNLAFSPASISIALAMTYGGARGETAAEMRKTLRFGVDDDVLHPAFADQLAAWNDPARTDYELSVVNRLFARTGLAFEPDYSALVRDRYLAPIEQLDFAGDADGARKHINAWVEKQTKDRIRDLLPVGSIDAGTPLVLTNAVYFKGTWKQEFEAEATQPLDFHPLGAATVRVPTMQMTADLPHATVDGVQILELPYDGDELAMDVLLPVERDGLDDLEKEFTAANVDRWVGALGKGSIAVALPKFKIEMPESIALKKPLAELGMALAFTDAADFSGMSKQAAMAIDDVYHKAFVEVNEEGTEAAAATAVVMRESAVSMQPTFIADHPFMFLIRDTRSNVILFVGRVANPA